MPEGCGVSCFRHATRASIIASSQACTMRRPRETVQEDPRLTVPFAGRPAFPRGGHGRPWWLSVGWERHHHVSSESATNTCPRTGSGGAWVCARRHLYHFRAGAQQERRIGRYPDQPPVPCVDLRGSQSRPRGVERCAMRPATPALRSEHKHPGSPRGSGGRGCRGFRKTSSLPRTPGRGRRPCTSPPGGMLRGSSPR